MTFPYVCFNISSLCDMKCPFCYRVGEKNGNITYKKAIQYIDFLAKHGCKSINITGGEPLLNPHWMDIINYCHSKKLFIILSTNGLKLDIDDPLLQKIDVLSIPLDGGSNSSNSKIRTVEHFEKIVNILEKYKTGNYNFKLKVNTVLTKYNSQELIKILNLVDNEKVIWKLFELRKKGHFYNFPDNKILQADIVVKIVNDIITKNHLCSIYFMKSESTTIDSVNPDYFVLNFNGDLYVAKKDEDQLLINIDPDDINIILENSSFNLNNQYFEDFKNDHT